MFLLEFARLAQLVSCFPCKFFYIARVPEDVVRVCRGQVVRRVELCPILVVDSSLRIDAVLFLMEFADQRVNPVVVNLAASALCRVSLVDQVLGVSVQLGGRAANGSCGFTG